MPQWLSEPFTVKFTAGFSDSLHLAWKIIDKTCCQQHVNYLVYTWANGTIHAKISNKKYCLNSTCSIANCIDTKTKMNIKIFNIIELYLIVTIVKNTLFSVCFRSSVYNFWDYFTSICYCFPQTWWPFSNRTGRTAFFVLVWPVIVHLLLTYLFRRRR